MKYTEYMKLHESENLSWCKPYTDETGKYVLVMCDGKPSSMHSPSQEVFCHNGTLTDDAMKQFAREVNPYYDLYNGWDDCHIALDAMHEVGCASCPWRENCEAMREEMN